MEESGLTIEKWEGQVRCSRGCIGTRDLELACLLMMCSGPKASPVKVREMLAQSCEVKMRNMEDGNDEPKLLGRVIKKTNDGYEWGSDPQGVGLG